MTQQASPVTREEVAGLEQRVRDEVPQLQSLDLSLGLAGQVRVDMLRVHYGHAGGGRGQGHGTRALAMITEWADRRGVVLVCSPFPAHLDGQRRTGKRRLRKFYVRAGFVNNRGRHPEYGATMFRDPKPHGDERCRNGVDDGLCGDEQCARCTRIALDADRANGLPDTQPDDQPGK